MKYFEVNKYIMLAAGFGLIAASYFAVGVPNVEIGDTTFGFVPITNSASIGYNAITLAGYILGLWVIYDAFKKFRQ